MTRPALWLQRHAPVIAAPGWCYGATDLDADPAATHEAARRIAAVLPAGFSIVSSPLRRCRLLADAVAALRPGVSVRHDARIAEMDFGAWEGRPWADVPREAFDAWTANFADTAAGGNGESVRTFMARVAAARADWLAGGVEALWVTHAGVLRAMALLDAGVACPERADQWPSDAAPFGAWRVLGAA